VRDPNEVYRVPEAERAPVPANGASSGTVVAE